MVTMTNRTEQGVAQYRRWSLGMKLVLCFLAILTACSASGLSEDSEDGGGPGCVPQCEGRECGYDGCGGSCGACYNLEGGVDDSLCMDGVCQCTPSCVDRECGPDGCGGVCGHCFSVEGAVDDSLCVGGSCQQCAAACDGMECGPDGCGGTCGECPAGHSCDAGKCKSNCGECPEGTACGLDDNHPTLCVGEGCPDGLDFEGECIGASGNTVRWCDEGMTYAVDCDFLSAGAVCTWNEQLGRRACASSCLPQCADKECGADGCGGVCGTCKKGELCEDDLCLSGPLETCEMVKWNGHHYAMCPLEQEVSWNAAQQTCAAWGANLVVLSSPDEWDMVVQKMGESSFWLGLTDLGKEGDWTWSDGSDPQLFADWCNGEPNDYGSGEDCAMATLNGSGCFNDCDCGEEGCNATGIVCETDTECVKQCAGKECGPDGCGGGCGQCGVYDSCVDGSCLCEKECNGKNCGPDGCGGVCGKCASNETCENGHCECDPSCSSTCFPPQICPANAICGQMFCGAVAEDGCGGTCTACHCPDCTPQCAGKECGNNGCNGSCGQCASGYTCVDYQCKPINQCPPNSSYDPASQLCQCKEGYVGSPDGNLCWKLGGPCMGVDNDGYCDGDFHVWCYSGSLYGVKCAHGCEEKPFDAGCKCYFNSGEKVCSDFYGDATNSWLLECVDGLWQYKNCKVWSGNPAAGCYSFVYPNAPTYTIHGCLCDFCTMMNPLNNQCDTYICW